MDFIIFLCFFTIVGMLLILTANKKTLQDKVLKIVGWLILISLIINIKTISKFFYQVYFIDTKEIVQIKLEPLDDYSCIKSLKKEIFINDLYSIQVISLSVANNLKLKRVVQPNCLRIFSLTLIHDNGKKYKYRIRHTSNNGTLVNIQSGKISLGTFTSNNLMENLYKTTNNTFFKI